MHRPRQRLFPPLSIVLFSSRRKPKSWKGAFHGPDYEEMLNVFLARFYLRLGFGYGGFVS